MKYIDLHVHSNASDGTMTPGELVEYAASKGLAAIALTDHDTINGLSEAMITAEQLTAKGIPIQIIPGVELSVSYKSRDIHMLGLMIDYKDAEFREKLDSVLREREQRNLKMIQNLSNAGIDITLEKLKECQEDGVITRAHFAKFLVKYNYVKTTKDAFSRYLNENGPYYVPRKYLTPKEAISLIHKVGGVAILAHPLLYKLPVAELEQLTAQLKEEGLDGLEAIYSSNIEFQERDMLKLARKYNLLVTGGSDFHGSNKPLLDIGTGKGNLKIPYSILETL